MYKQILLLVFSSILFYSCNPMMHIKGAAMRKHNLSQNKNQSGQQRKKIRVGTSPNSPFWYFFRKF